MFFVASKLFWFVAAPTNLLLICAGIGIVLLMLGYFRTGRALACAGLIGLVILAATPLPRILARPLEDRFAQVRDETSPIHGIIVLGGAIGNVRGTVELNKAAERLTESARLALLHPQAKLVFSGGSLNLISNVSWTEAGEAGRFYRGLGIDPSRLILEDQSRNTRENAVLTARQVAPKPGERWLLVTSAYHMPRSIGLFRKAGLNLEAFPVDYSTSGRIDDFLRPHSLLSRNLVIADDIIKEYIGLLAYRLSGYTDELFPGP